MGKDLFLYKGMKRILAIITGLTIIQTAAIILQAEWLSQAVTGLFNGKRIASLSGYRLFPACVFGPACGNRGPAENRVPICRANRRRLKKKIS